MEHVEVIQRFVLDHVVADEEAIQSNNAKEFIARIDELLGAIGKRPHHQHLLSWISSDPATNVGSSLELFASSTAASAPVARSRFR